MEPNRQARIDDLMRRARQAHTTIGTLHRQALTHAREAGEALAELKALITQEGPGVWPAWVQPNLGFTRRHAENYIRVYEHWEQYVAPFLDSDSDMTLTDVLDRISAATGTRRPCHEPHAHEPPDRADDPQPDEPEPQADDPQAEAPAVQPHYKVTVHSTDRDQLALYARLLPDPLTDFNRGTVSGAVLPERIGPLLVEIGLLLRVGHPEAENRLLAEGTPPIAYTTVEVRFIS